MLKFESPAIHQLEVTSALCINTVNALQKNSGVVMKKLVFVIYIVSICLVLSAHENIIVNSSSSRTLDIRVSLAEIQFNERNFPDGNSYSTIGRPVGSELSKGKPDVPGFARWILIPNGTDVNISTNRGTPIVYENVDLAPVQSALPELKGIPAPGFLIDEVVYSQNSDYPGIFAEIEPIKRKRGQDCTILWIYPYQYNPVQKKLFVYPDLQININFSGNIEPIPSNLRDKNMENILRSMAINGDEIIAAENKNAPYERETTREDGCELLIITHPNFQNAAEVLANWKKRKGIITQIATTDETGNTASQIEDFIDNTYYNWDPAPSYLLLIGDSEYIPTNYVNVHPYHGADTASDLFYADIGGFPDYIADIGFGRLSVDNQAQADSLVARIIRYERNPVDDPSFYTNATIAGAFQDGSAGSPPNTIADRRFAKTSEDVKNFLDSEGYNAQRIYTTYNGYGGNEIFPTYWSDEGWANFENDEPGQEIPEYLQKPAFPWIGNSWDVTNAMNNGSFFLLHRDHGGRHGWGEPDYDCNDVDNLSNGEKSPIVFSINCNTGWYDNETDEGSYGTDQSDECFVEHWIRHTSGGSVGVMGSTRVSYSGYNDRLVWGWMDAMFPDFTTWCNDPYGDEYPIYKFGDILNYGKEYMMTKVDDDEVRRTALEEFHWFGDPTMEMWTRFPMEITADHPQVIPLGTSQIQIGCDVDGALVSLVYNNEILGTDIAAFGSATIEFEQLFEVGTVYLTISKHDYLVYEAEIEIIAEGAYVICEDQIFEELDGHLDGSFQSLDRLELDLTLQNIGLDATGDNCLLILETDPVFADIVTDSLTFWQIPAGEEVFIENAFQILLLPGITDSTLIPFFLTIISDGITWQSEFDLQVQAAQIVIEDFLITIDNDEDNILDPGETAEVELFYRNIGAGYSYDLTTTMFSYDPYVSLSGSDLVPQIDPGELVSSTQILMLEIPENCPNEYFITVELLMLNDAANDYYGSFNLAIGMVYYDLENVQESWEHFALSDDYIDQWHLSDFRNNSLDGSFSMKFGGEDSENYSTFAHGGLLIPEVELNGNNYLKFHHWLDTPEINDTLCYDGAMLEISLDGEDVEQIEPIGGYPANMINIPSSPFESGTPLFAGHFEWEEVEFDLSDHSGLAQIRFVFGSAGFSTGEGWYIDDIKIGKYEDTETNDLNLTNDGFRLTNYPNPFHSSTTISFQFSNEQNKQVQLDIYNLKGQHIKSLPVILNEAEGSIDWNGKDDFGKPVASGIYFYKFQADDISAIKKMILMR